MRAALVFAAVLLVLKPSSTHAFNPDCGLYQYEARIVSVYDGDTVRADVDLGFNTWRRNERFRLFGIDTPELWGVSDEVKARGIAARDALRDRILDKDVLICTIKDRTGKYGRYLARIFVEGEDVNAWLISSGHAVPYE